MGFFGWLGITPSVGYATEMVLAYQTKYSTKLWQLHERLTLMFVTDCGAGNWVSTQDQQVLLEIFVCQLVFGDSESVVLPEVQSKSNVSLVNCVTHSVTRLSQDFRFRHDST